MKKLLFLVFLFIFAAMLWATIVASLDRNVLTAAAEIWNDPWGRATLFDAYFAFFAVYLWIAARERSWGLRGLWLVLLMTLGNFAIAAYFLKALWGLAADEPWYRIFDVGAGARQRRQSSTDL